MRVAQELVPFLGSTPQPVALALGRVVRALGPAEQLDASIKASEVIARYLGIVGVASAARAGGDRAPLAVDGFDGNLSFGAFEKAARAAYGTRWDHPLRAAFRRCLQSSRRSPAIAGSILEKLVQLRNELGHAITHADEARARAVMERDDPIGCLVNLVVGLDEILAFPLLTVLEQHHRHGRLLARMSFFVGEGEPFPQEIELMEPVFEWEVPYLCTPGGLLNLSPGLLYVPRSTDGRLGLHLLDGISDAGLRYKDAYSGSTKETADGLQDLSEWVQLPSRASGAASPAPRLEDIHCSDGRTLHAFLSEPQRVDDGGTRSDTAPAGGGGGAINATQPTSIRDFEDRINPLGIGAAYRDTLYALVELGGQAEVSGLGVRVVSKDDPSRVFATLEMTPAMTLHVSIFGGPVGGGDLGSTKAFELKSGDAADSVIYEIEQLHAVGHEV